MKWNICPSKDLAQLNITIIDRNLRHQGVLKDNQSFSEIFRVGHHTLETHPRYYHQMPYQEVLDMYFSGAKEAKTLKGIIEYEVVETDPAEETTYPRIWDLCLEHLKGQCPKEIEYKKHLDDYQTMNSVMSFTDDGFLLSAEYYHDYVDSQNKGNLVIKVDEVYTTDPDQSGLDPCAREPISRDKSWTYYNLDGTVYKVWHKSKLYDTRDKKAKEGLRRRSNIISILVQNTALAGILSGVWPTEDDAKTALTNLLATYSSSFTVYKETGRGEVFSDVENDATPAHAWMNTVVVDTPQTQAMCPWMIGMSLRDYIVEKLKGNIK